MSKYDNNEKIKPVEASDNNTGKTNWKNTGNVNEKNTGSINGKNTGKFTGNTAEKITNNISEKITENTTENISGNITENITGNTIGSRKKGNEDNGTKKRHSKTDSVSADDDYEYVENWKIEKAYDDDNRGKAKFIGQCCLMIVCAVFFAVAMVMNMNKKNESINAAGTKADKKLEAEDTTGGDKEDKSKKESDEEKNKNDGSVEDINKDTNKDKNKDTTNKLPYPVISQDYADISADIPGTFVAVYDVDNNQVLVGRNADTRMYPASMTKVMTLIVAVENIKDLNQKFTMTSDIIDPLFEQQASSAGFDAGESVSAKDLLYGLILPSGADAAVGLATMIAGSEENFVKLMNDKCKEMGLKGTHFTNVSGLHNTDNYTTAIEQAYIMAYAMQNKTCAEVLGTYQYTTEATPQHPEGILLTSTMYGRMYGNEVPGMTITGGKTGYTDEARHCLVSFAKRNSDGHTYVAVTANVDKKWDCIYDAFKIYNMYTDVQGEIATIEGGHDD